MPAVTAPKKATPTKSSPLTPSFATELYTFASSLRDVPYNELSRVFFDAGWLTHLHETGTTPCYDGTVIVHFDLYVGKAFDAMEVLDTLSVRLAPGPGPISIAGRLSARESVIFLISGRIPPMPQQAPPPNPVPEPRQTDDIDITLPGEEPLPPEPAAQLDDAPTVRVVDHREADGLPIFRDLYDIGADEVRSTGEIIDAVLAEIQTFLETADSVEAVNALAAKNPVMMTFVKDVGEERDIADLRAMVSKRRNELERPAAAPRRRTPSVPRAN